uniref:Uncharacterized protein n=1 Tax=Heterorhabditis bacteriophora TaxID=37862 RepID=A0A1I7X263_HETBA
MVTDLQWFSTPVCQPNRNNDAIEYTYNFTKPRNSQLCSGSGWLQRETAADLCLPNETDSICKWRHRMRQMTDGSRVMRF